ncbi:MAG: hypothetical protein A3A80_03415 [Candidatus Terrybacteria bacterium RIFCSPLOWO2_01_FULL_44_24]|uniref:Thioredoxin domain-containing protein n=1 Tax=Candidatus Terrybacteria bacterium RIFCSPHIGHO2_01_FULL_43_35 TaxID=1802361 RepID=A0A1G2PDL6_9BACT|nr:MAG: hypothetical protein A2828_00330 [Candidatus Terrybacteria bacterium RIFCSPHIGHO2_01_FULL_43_35]OHA49734.1 MAG: hypothetical protein A3B75_01905 [Candidatus Terrybacteria bacterium RIFCSPHIGHO2_02_FULL_43_14]OHA51557.1 MAG: hypothetical protein A3A80_03415 [Candidatus Terrybacteria bacterium RIFCSPLOWO2_01_FULL_44_24]
MFFNKKKSSYQQGILPYIVVPILIVGVFLVWKNIYSPTSPKAEAKQLLAECLTAKGVKMYGAFWCSHCAQQKKEFGDAWRKISYIECSPNGDRNAFAQECKDADIKGYPTWVFPDDSRLQGEQTMAKLAQKSGCTFETQ